MKDGNGDEETGEEEASPRGEARGMEEVKPQGGEEDPEPDHDFYHTEDVKPAIPTKPKDSLERGRYPPDPVERPYDLIHPEPDKDERKAENEQQASKGIVAARKIRQDGKSLSWGLSPKGTFLYTDSDE